MLIILAMVMPVIGLGQTTSLLLEDKEIENNFVSMSEQNMENVFKNGTIAWCKKEIAEENCYVKKCLITGNSENSFLEVLLVSEIIEDPDATVKCAYIETRYYDNRVLYVKKGSEKLFLQASNVLNWAYSTYASKQN